MRSTFMGFETATRSLMATQKALDVINNNIGNIGVTGYTRQRVDLVSMSVNNRYSRYADNRVGLAGQGVTVNGVSQVRDSFLDKRFREEYADVGYHDKMTEVLTDLGVAIDEIEPSNMTTALDNFKKAWDTLGKENGTDPVALNSLQAAARALTQGFQQMSTKVNNVWGQQSFDLGVDVNAINSMLERVANLNDAIKKEVFSSGQPGNGYYFPNELVDQQNVLLDQLSKFGNLDVRKNEDGTVTVRMGECSCEGCKGEGHIVVNGDKFDKLLVNEDQNNQTVSIEWQSNGEEAAMRTGSLKGYMDMLNGRGNVANMDAGEKFERGVLFYKDKIDTFATVMARTFNNIIEEVDPVTNQPTGSYKQLFTFGGNGDPTAANLQLNTQWENSSDFIVKNIRQEGGKHDTSFVAKALAAFSDTLDFGDGFKGTLNGYVQSYSNANLGNQREFHDSRLTACSDVADSILNRISEISGVSMEEEGIDTMQYTKAFQAMSRVMTALDETLDVLINRTGLVGR